MSGSPAPAPAAALVRNPGARVSPLHGGESSPAARQRCGVGNSRSGDPARRRLRLGAPRALQRGVPAGSAGSQPGTPSARLPALSIRPTPGRRLRLLLLRPRSSCHDAARCSIRGAGRRAGGRRRRGRAACAASTGCSRSSPGLVGRRDRRRACRRCAVHGCGTGRLAHAVERPSAPASRRWSPGRSRRGLRDRSRALACLQRDDRRRLVPARSRARAVRADCRPRVRAGRTVAGALAARGHRGECKRHLADQSGPFAVHGAAVHGARSGRACPNRSRLAERCLGAPDRGVARLRGSRSAVERPDRCERARVPGRPAEVWSRDRGCGRRSRVCAGRSSLLAEELPETRASALPGTPVRARLRRRCLVAFAALAPVGAGGPASARTRRHAPGEAQRCGAALELCRGDGCLLHVLLADADSPPVSLRRPSDRARVLGLWRRRRHAGSRQSLRSAR